MLDAKQIEERLRQRLPSARIRATDLTGGGDHWQLDIKAREFAGLSLIEQHQLVYQTLGEWMKKEIHALALNTDEA